MKGIKGIRISGMGRINKINKSNIMNRMSRMNKSNRMNRMNVTQFEISRQAIPSTILPSFFAKQACSGKDHSKVKNFKN